MVCHVANYTYPHRYVNTDSYLTHKYSEPHNQTMDFEDWLKTEIDRQGLKQKALEEMTTASGKTVTQATISRITNHKQTPSFSDAVALARVLGYTADAFMQGGEQQPRLSDIESEVVELMRKTTPRGRIEIALVARQTVDRYDSSDTNGGPFGSSPSRKAG